MNGWDALVLLGFFALIGFMVWLIFKDMRRDGE